MGIILTSTGLPLLTSTGLIAPRAALAGSGGTVPVPVPKPDPGAIALRGPASSIAYRGVTFTFSSPVSWYESANGDPVVISHADYMPAGTSITSTSPASTTSAGDFKMHGLVRDPADIHQMEGIGSLLGQGFDAAIGTDEHGGPKNYPYNDALNIDPGNTRRAVPIGTGDAFVLVKAVRHPDADDHSAKPVGKYVALAVMNSLPPRAGTWFRPAIAAPTKAWPGLPLEEMDFTTKNSPLRHLSAPDRLKTATEALAEIRAWDTHTVPIWSYTGEIGRRSQIYAEIDPGTHYASDIGVNRAEYALVAHAAANQADRKALLKILIQWGIDCDGAHQAGIPHHNGAGQAYGYLMFFYLAGFMLGDAAMIGRAQHHLENTVGQPIWVTPKMIGYPVDWDIGSDGGNAKRVGETYQIEHLGVPDWSFSGWQNRGIGKTASPPPAGRDSASWYAAYRDTNWNNAILGLMPILLLRNGPSPALATGDLAVLRGGSATDTGWAPGAAIAYMDRSRYVNRINQSGVRSHNQTARNVWDDWRDYVPTPKWEGPPCISSNNYNSEVLNFETGANSGEIFWDWNSYNFSIRPIVKQQVSYSLDGVQWSAPIDIGLARTFMIAGLRPGTLHWCRWRQQNDLRQWSIWSPHWPLNHQNGSANAKGKAPRNQATSGGSTPASGPLTNTAAPKIVYKPYPLHPQPVFEPAPADLGAATVYPADQVSAVTLLHCGLGYWSGGSGQPGVSYGAEFESQKFTGWSVAYQWRRGGAPIAGATGWSYDISGESPGAVIDCRVTVEGVPATSNAVTAP